MAWGGAFDAAAPATCWPGADLAAVFALSCSGIGEALIGFILEDGYLFALAALAAVAG